MLRCDSWWHVTTTWKHLPNDLKVSFELLESICSTTWKSISNYLKVFVNIPYGVNNHKCSEKDLFLVVKIFPKQTEKFKLLQVTQKIAFAYLSVTKLAKINSVRSKQRWINSQIFRCLEYILIVLIPAFTK